MVIVAIYKTPGHKLVFGFQIFMNELRGLRIIR